LAADGRGAIVHEPLRQIGHLLATEREPFAMATLVSAKGSTPRSAGSKMWVDARGGVLGTVTIGGCVDARVIEAAARVLATGMPELLALSLGDDEAWEIGLTCGGSVEVLVERVSPGTADPIAAAYRAAMECVERGEAAVIATALDGSGARRLVVDTGATGSLGDAHVDAAIDALAGACRGSALETIADGAGGRRVYLERHAPPETVVIYGAGEVARALVPIVGELGMQTVLVDARERYATPERFPGVAAIHVGMASEITSTLALTPRTYAVLVVHDYKVELPVLGALLRSDLGYVGMLGSRRRGETIRQLLREDGLAPDEIARLRTPIGLDIGARTPAEIALAIAAELVAVREGKR
jgi:xanthine dehydrogenase accessory factor